MSGSSSVGGIRRLRRAPIVAGLVTGVVIVAVGLVFALTQPSGWASDSTLVVTPSGSVAGTASAAYYETLSHGQVVSTYAEMLRLSDLERRTKRLVGVAAGDEGSTSISIHVVPDTSLIVMRASSPSRQTAERLAVSAAYAGAVYLSNLKQPFAVSTLRSANTSAKRTGGDAVPIVVVAVAVAIVAALLAARSVMQLMLIVDARSARSTADSVDPDESAPAVATLDKWH